MTQVLQKLLAIRCCPGMSTTPCYSQATVQTHSARNVPEVISKLQSLSLLALLVLRLSPAEPGRAPASTRWIWPQAGWGAWGSRSHSEASLFKPLSYAGDYRISEAMMSKALCGRHAL
jgi:hypothetical protein